MRALPIVERILRRVQIGVGNGDCWLWLGAIDADGYPIVEENHGAVKVHRTIWEFEHRQRVADDFHILHRCDNRLCVRPSHLYAGTNADNVRDRVDRERGSRGEHRPQAKLTEAQVKAMRRRRDWGWSYRAIGEWAGVHEATAALACRGRTWKHVA